MLFHDVKLVYNFIYTLSIFLTKYLFLRMYSYQNSILSQFKPHNFVSFYSHNDVF